MRLSIRASPFAFIVTPTDPPALPRQPITFPDDEDSKLWFAPRRAAPINLIENFAQRAHLWSGETISKQKEQFGITQRLTPLCRILYERFDTPNIEQGTAWLRKIVIKEFVDHQSEN
jgi:hypothetical protein